MLSHKISLDVVKAASESGISHATWLLSQMYKLGIGVQPSEEKANYHLLTASTQGSLRARSEVARNQLRGNANDLPHDLALRLLADLADEGFARTEIGETLIMSGKSEFVERGYQALKLESLQCFNWKARYLVLLCDVFNKNIPVAKTELLNTLLYLNRCEGNIPAQHAIILSSFLGLNPWTFTYEDLVVSLLEINTPEASIDAWQMLSVPTFEFLKEELRHRAFAQLAAHAETDHPHAQVTYLAALLNHAQPKDEGACATRLLKLMKRNPELHSLNYDYALHYAKASTPGLAELIMETMSKIAASPLAPYANRTLAIELNMAGRWQETEKYFVRAMELAIENSISCLASFAFKRYDKTNQNFAEARFWAEAFVLEDAEEGQRTLHGLLELRKKRNSLSHDESLVQRECLEFLCKNDNADAKRYLGLMLLNGQGPVLREPVRGLELLKEAAQTDGRAMYELAHVYQAGVHVPRDMSLAQHFFDEAAKHGHSNAQYEVIDAEQKAQEENQNEETTPSENAATVTSIFTISSVNETQ